MSSIRRRLSRGRSVTTALRRLIPRRVDGDEPLLYPTVFTDDPRLEPSTWTSTKNAVRLDYAGAGGLHPLNNDASRLSESVLHQLQALMTTASSRDLPPNYEEQSTRVTDRTSIVYESGFSAPECNEVAGHVNEDSRAVVHNTGPISPSTFGSLPFNGGTVEARADESAPDIILSSSRRSQDSRTLTTTLRRWVSRRSRNNDDAPETNDPPEPEPFLLFESDSRPRNLRGYSPERTRYQLTDDYASEGRATVGSGEDWDEQADSSSVAEPGTAIEQHGLVEDIVQRLLLRMDIGHSEEAEPPSYASAMSGRTIVDTAAISQVRSRGDGTLGYERQSEQVLSVSSSVDSSDTVTIQPDPRDHDVSGDAPRTGTIEGQQRATRTERNTATLSIFVQLCDYITYYEQLRSAKDISQIDCIRARIILEWQYVGATLLAVAAINATVFGFSDQTAFDMDLLAFRFLALSAIATAFGICSCGSLLILYLSADAQRFATLARGVYSDYIFFAITSRLPFAALFISLLTLAFFLFAVVFPTWPSAVITVCLSGTTLGNLQYIAKSVELLYVGLLMALERAYSTARTVRSTVSNPWQRLRSLDAHAHSARTLV